MSSRSYILRSPQPGMKGRDIAELTTFENGSEHAIVVLHLPDGTPPELLADALAALRSAYENGREDRSAELIPAGEQPADLLRRLVHEHTIAAIHEWGLGWTDPEDGVQYRISLEAADEANHVLDLGIGCVRYKPEKKFRVRVLVEELP